MRPRRREQIFSVCKRRAGSQDPPRGHAVGLDAMQKRPPVAHGRRTDASGRIVTGTGLDDRVVRGRPQRGIGGRGWHGRVWHDRGRRRGDDRERVALGHTTVGRGQRGHGRGGSRFTGGCRHLSLHKGLAPGITGRRQDRNLVFSRRRWHRGRGVRRRLARNLRCGRRCGSDCGYGLRWRLFRCSRARRGGGRSYGLDGRDLLRLERLPPTACERPGEEAAEHSQQRQRRGGREPRGDRRPAAIRCHRGTPAPLRARRLPRGSRFVAGRRMLRRHVEQLPALGNAEGFEEPRLASDLRQNFMAGGDVGEVDVGLDADPLEGLQPFGVQHVVEKLGGRIGIIGQTAAHGRGRREPLVPDDGLGPLDQGRSDAAGGHLLAQGLLVLGSKHPVDPCQQGSDGQTHLVFLGPLAMGSDVGRTPLVRVACCVRFRASGSSCKTEEPGRSSGPIIPYTEKNARVGPAPGQGLRFLQLGRFDGTSTGSLP